METLRVTPLIDHTLLRADASREDIERLCTEARQYGFAAVCVNGCWVELAAWRLEETDIKVATVVGFPLGACDPDVKRFETETAIEHGAHEIDMVINLAWLKAREDRKLFREIRDVVEAAEGRTVKVILETALLNEEEKRLGCELAKGAGARFVKTSTGFGPGGATVEDVRLLREAVGPHFGVKASGGIRNLGSARALVRAGANRIGTSSGVLIAQEEAREAGEGSEPGQQPAEPNPEEEE
ncbi:MAG: deoxyribose-phosphate aldolase [Verrucomicrobia bacterium]|nr:MAG: deoxyribose-phosphate aldolase [Verrucomicrobiota bacterium]